MLRNYFKTAFRNLLRNKVFSIVNISGLAIGMASTILILLWIQDEMGFDRFHAKTDRIYMMHTRDQVNGQLMAGNQTPVVLAPALKKDYPEVADAVRFNNVTFLLTSGEKRLNAQGAFADSGFLSVFSFKMLNGDEKALSGNSNIVLTEGLAKSLFGDENPMGKIVRIDSAENFMVTGVLKELPDNTVFDFQYLLPRTYMTRLGWDDDNWTNNFAYTYTLLKPGASAARFDEKIKNIIKDHSRGSVIESKAEVFTQPLSRLYLYSRSENGQLVGGRIERVRLFGIIALFILLTACINFMNLSTARSYKRAKEVGIRKVIGAQKSSLVTQFILESILLVSVAFVIAVLAVQFSLPAFNSLAAKRLQIEYGNPFYWFFALVFILFTGFLAGSYPAFFLSSFLPVKVLKGAIQKVNALVTPRKVLVVLQFSFAIVLIISTIIVGEQIHHSQDRDAGYNRNNLVFTFTQGDVNKNFDPIKHELLSSGAVVSITRSYNPITRRWADGSGYQWPGSTAADQKTDFVQMGSDADFVKTIGVKLVEGRDIDVYNYKTDSTAMLLNEAAVKIMGLKNPVGQVIKRVGYDQQWHVIGVVKDFILESPYANINPTMIIGPTRWSQVIHFKLNPAQPVSVSIAKAEQIFRKYNPQYPFEYVFVDQSYARKFEDEKRTEVLAGLFAGLSIFISCLGLFGLATYMAESRIKEIGVRKVLGAGVFSITGLLSREFLKLVLIAFIIASPVAWYIMHEWLQGYTYRVTIEWWVFASAGLLSVLIACCTVGYQAIKAAVANPVNSLRSE